MIKLYIPMLAIFLFVSCSGNSREQLDKRVAANAIIEKNKQTALANEAAEVTQAIQKLEKQGRDMESFRQAADAESRRQCNTVMDDRQQQVKILEEKIKKFPNPSIRN